MGMWHERWAEQKTGWDLNGPHPLTKILFERVQALHPQVAKGRWLIPGCGRAHDGPFLLESGASSVEGRDLVPLAIEEAQRLYGHIQNMKFRCGDINDLSHSEVGAFDGVFDRAMLCALEGENRVNYVRSCERYLKLGGVFASLAFASTFEPEIGPPFQITKQQIEALFGKGWRIESLEERRDGVCGQKILSEWVLIARKL